MKHLNVPLDEESLRRIKAAAARNGQTLKVWVAEALMGMVEREESFNADSEAEILIRRARERAMEITSK